MIPNGIDHAADLRRRAVVCRRRRCQRINWRILSLGRLNWKKGLDRLIEALAHVPGAELVIAGNDEDGYRSKLEELAA